MPSSRRFRKKVIGRVSFDSGYEIAETDCTLELGQEYRHKGYGKEAVALAAGLGFMMYKEGAKVLANEFTAPVEKFTASALDRDAESIRWISKLGLGRFRTFPGQEGLMRVYAVDGSQLAKGQFFALDKFTFEVKCVSPIQKAAVSPALSSGSK